MTQQQFEAAWRTDHLVSLSFTCGLVTCRLSVVRRAAFIFGIGQNHIVFTTVAVLATTRIIQVIWRPRGLSPKLQGRRACFVNPRKRTASSSLLCSKEDPLEDCWISGDSDLRNMKPGELF
ncbi:uncharacterized protein ATNIH1004_005763 [Aspergillus tanneri]|uniref:Uncharacterized protein n=1 Tax=Aspergillus tanneri TaxID=1220188 RepID=A0A5M9MP38_9EURO|nr:uncharacterized protein ATNIH1004_005763 [Aspergillus tanneri]KAA8647080.1 hypothetical protein ATNIH1004_005763 [Aspergillus tanneri]